METMSSGPLPDWCAPVARVASVAYGLGARWRGERFGRSGGMRIGRPVISVGNIVAGGTGKSPVVRWVCSTCIDAGVRPLIAMRGYRSRHGRSDEASEHMASLDGVPVVAHPDRAPAIAHAIRKDPTIGVVVLDDGFQHRRVARDLDIVLVDATRPCLDDRLLPFGWQRERARALARAGAVVVTHACSVDSALAAQIESHHGKPPLAWCDHEWSGVDLMRPGSDALRAASPADVRWLAGRRVAIWAGVARPELIRQQAEASGATVVAMPLLRDHAHYSASAVRRLGAEACDAGAEAILMTGKDWVKVEPLAVALPLPAAVARLSLRFCAGEEQLRQQVVSATRSRVP
jgi:tetraacyldisaccharide 4'-kinase